MPKKSSASGTSRLHSKSSQSFCRVLAEAIDPVAAVQATPHNGDGISINLTINNPGSWDYKSLSRPG